MSPKVEALFAVIVKACELEVVKRGTHPEAADYFDQLNFQFNFSKNKRMSAAKKKGWSKPKY